MERLSLFINKIIISICMILFYNSAIANPPSDRLGWHWMWNNGCVNFDLHHPYKYLFKLRFEDKGDEKIPSYYDPLYYLKIWDYVFTEIHSYVPHLSPREIEWLEEEIKSKDRKRRDAAEKTVEFYKYNLSNIVHFKLSLINAYKNETNEKEKKKILYRFAWSLKNYAYNFVRAYSELLNKDLISPLPSKWKKLKIFKNSDDNYSIKNDWDKAYDFIVKCYIAGY